MKELRVSLRSGALVTFRGAEDVGWKDRTDLLLVYDVQRTIIGAINVEEMAYFKWGEEKIA